MVLQRDIHTTKKSVHKKNGIRSANRKDQTQLFLLALPAMIMIIVFKYLPMFGIIIAFKNYKYNLGIFNSPWVGLNNFKFFFKSNDAAVVLRNALCYNGVMIPLGAALSIAFALMLTFIKRRKIVNFVQNAMFQHFLLSWVVVAYVSVIFLNPKSGVLNMIITSLGFEKISWYSEPVYWPFILVFFHMWKGVGYNTLLYYTAMLNIDDSIYESATLDGCKKLKQAWYITIPMIKPTIVMLLLLSIGGIFNLDFGLFYQIPQNSGELRAVTDTIETYSFRMLTVTGDTGIAGAVTLMQSAVGFLLVVITNKIVKKYDKENALF